MIFYYNSSSAASTNPSSGSPAHSVILIHQIHVAGGASRSATMVVVFAVVCVVCSGLVWLSSLVVCRQVPQNNLKMRLTALLGAPHWLAPYPPPYGVN